MKNVPHSHEPVGPGAAYFCFAIGVAVLLAKFIALASYELLFRLS